MLPAPHATATPALTVVRRSLSGRPQMYRLARPGRSRSVTAMCRHLADALVAARPGRLAPAA